MSWQGQWEGQWQGKWDGSIEVNPNAMYGTAVGTSSASGTLTTVSQTPEESKGGIPEHILRWWLNKHKKKPVETVEEALEIVQETVQEATQKPRVAPQIVAARDDYQLQLFIARQILAARQELDRYQRELEDEEEAILALLL